MEIPAFAGMTVLVVGALPVFRVPRLRGDDGACAGMTVPFASLLIQALAESQNGQGHQRNNEPAENKQFPRKFLQAGSA